jgi:hypothetical protein
MVFIPEPPCDHQRIRTRLAQFALAVACRYFGIEKRFDFV